MMKTINDISCTPNISFAERRKRLMAGAITFTISLIGLAVLILLEANVWLRLALFPLFMGAAVGYFQWRDET